MQGQILGGRYEVREELGTGGMGTVYAGRDLRTLGMVAIKLAHPWLARDPDYAVRLRREAEISASLQSQRIVKIIDFDWHEGRPFLVMEYLPGPTLADRLNDEGRLGWAEAATIALEVARALEAAHEAGVVHRDLSPKNIKLVDGRVKVLDFGIARSDSLANLTATGVVLGSPDYCAPERLGGSYGGDAAALSRGDARSDIYSLGCVLYEMLAGRPPFLGDTHWAVIRAHISDPPDPLPGDVPGRLQEIVLHCLEKHPDDRYQKAATLAADLRAVVVPEMASGTGAGVVLSETMTDLNITQPLSRPLTPGLFDAATQPAPGMQATTAARAAVATPPPGRVAPATPPPPPVSAWEPAGTSRPRRPARLLAIGGVLAAVILGGAGAAIALNRGGGQAVVPPEPSVAAGAAVTATAEASPSPEPTAVPVAVSTIKLYHAGDDFTADRPSTELTTGNSLVICYGYQGAGRGTALAAKLLTATGEPAATTGTFTPAEAAGAHCDTVAEAAGLAGGSYVAVVQDRGEERGRVSFTLSAPPPPPAATEPPPPPVEQTPVVPQTVRPAPPAPVPTSRPVAVSTPAPVRTAAPPVVTQAPPVATEPPAPTPTPRPRATLVPGQ